MARNVALRVLHRVATQGAFASAALRAELGQRKDLDPRDRGLATELVYGVLRRRAQVDKSISALGKRLKDLDPKLHDIFRLAAYQILFLDRVPDHAAVDAAVTQAKKRRGRRGADLTNALLRKLTDKPPEKRLPPPPKKSKDPIGHIALSASLPRSIAELWMNDLGFEEALALGLRSLERAPLVLRSNARKIGRDALCEEVRGTAGAHPLAVHLPRSQLSLPQDLPAVVEGRATVQDEASMRIVDMLDLEPGLDVLDVCSAPGGKTTCIAETMDDRGRVVAHDRTRAKLERVEKNASRLDLSIIEVAEVLPPPDQLFDRVLVDAPCSGLGTLRRHPEIRWRFRQDDLQSLVRTQLQVVQKGAALTKPGGLLVYSVCTNTKAEAEPIVTSLEGFELLEVVRTSPSAPGQPDAFFAAKLRKL